MIKLIKSTFFNEKDTKEKLAQFILHSPILSMGEETKKFEQAFAKKQERKHAVFVNSGSSANLVLLQALLNIGTIKPGAYVGISALTWATNVMPIIQLGLVPVAIDVSLKTLNISPETLSPHIGKIDVLFLTNVLGFSDNIKAIKETCEKENIILLEDNCESLGSRAHGEMLGNFSLASTFSFFVAHHISTIEGGMVCTDDEDLYHMLVMVRAHGWDRNHPKEKQEHLRKKHDIDDFYSKYSFYELAYNVRPTDINGFLGNNQINYWDTIVEGRAQNFRKFNGAIRNNDELIPLDVDHMDTVSNFAMPLIARNKDLFEKYKKRFTDNDVEIRPIIAGDITKQPFYKKHVGDIKEAANAHFVHTNAFYFANNPELTPEEIDLLIKLLKK